MRRQTLLLLFLLSACAVGPDYERPDTLLPALWPWQDSQQKTTEEAEKQAEAASLWWSGFGDPVLADLIREGLKNNADILQAAARVSEARANLGYSIAERYPSVVVEGGARRTSNSAESRFRGNVSSSKPYNDFSLAAVLDFEIDIWGRLRRQSEAARAQLMSTKANRDAVRQAVASDIGAGYLSLRALDAKIRLTKETIDALQKAYDYQEKQFRFGSANTLTLNQAEAELEDARAQLPMLEQARNEQLSALSILLGREPRALVKRKIRRGAKIDALPMPPKLPEVLPSELLERRPDIQQAEQALVAANADIGVAKADYFPRLSLSALLGLSSGESNRLLRSSAREWNAGANLAAPLVGFGRASSTLDAATARKEQAVATYRKAVQNAFKDVMDAMSAIETSTLRVKAQNAHRKARRESLRIAEERYKAGYSNYLEVVDARRFLYRAQQSHIEAMQDRLTAYITLYKAMGGHWSKPDPTGSDDAAAQAAKDKSS